MAFYSKERAADEIFLACRPFRQQEYHIPQGNGPLVGVGMYPKDPGGLDASAHLVKFLLHLLAGGSRQKGDHHNA